MPRELKSYGRKRSSNHLSAVGNGIPESSTTTALFPDWHTRQIEKPSSFGPMRCSLHLGSSMRYLVLSDLHSNLEALQAVLAMTHGEYEQVVCCGDLVGYGPDPDPVVDWVREHVTDVVRGNHDRACCGVSNAEDFNEAARMAAFWTRGRLKPENLQYLRNLPQGPAAVMNQFAILHGSPQDEDEYITTCRGAAESISSLHYRLSFFGHTHLQGGFFQNSSRVVEMLPLAVPPDSTRVFLEIQPDHIYYLNPGSVGQPRDRDNRAAFAIYDTAGTVEYGRTPYEVAATMTKMRQAGLPEFLAYRLSIGR